MEGASFFDKYRHGLRTLGLAIKARRRNVVGILVYNVRVTVYQINYISIKYSVLLL